MHTFSGRLVLGDVRTGHFPRDGAPFACANACLSRVTSELCKTVGWGGRHLIFPRLSRLENMWVSLTLYRVSVIQKVYINNLMAKLTSLIASKKILQFELKTNIFLTKKLNLNTIYRKKKKIIINLLFVNK